MSVCYARLRALKGVENIFLIFSTGWRAGELLVRLSQFEEEEEEEEENRGI